MMKMMIIHRMNKIMMFVQKKILTIKMRIKSSKVNKMSMNPSVQLNLNIYYLSNNNCLKLIIFLKNLYNILRILKKYTIILKVCLIKNNNLYSNPNLILSKWKRMTKRLNSNIKRYILMLKQSKLCQQLKS